MEHVKLETAVDIIDARCGIYYTIKYLIQSQMGKNSLDTQKVGES